MTVILPQQSSATDATTQRRRIMAAPSFDSGFDTDISERFAQLIELTADVIGVPIASVVLLESGRPVTKAVFGRPPGDLVNEAALIEQTLLSGGLLVVEDMPGDPRFRRSPAREAESFISSFAGAVVFGPDARAAGALCVLDTQPREFTESQLQQLTRLAGLVEHELRSLTTEADLRRRIRDHVLVDAATHLPTEGLFVNRLGRWISADDAGAVMVAILRLERFEAIHSAVGKAGAAFLVREAALRLEQTLGRNALIGQLREDALICACPQQHADEPDLQIQKLLQCFRAPFVLGEHRLAQIVNIGTSMFPHDGDDAESLLRRARTALHAIPASDTSRYRQYNRSLSAEAARRFEMETALKGGIERDEFELHFQPKIRLSTGELSGAEALLRWTSERFGVVSPEQFVPIAEESGQIGDLGDWVVDAACKQLAHWLSTGHRCPQISVNISSMQLRQPGFCRRIETTLERYSLDGALLNVEITEGSLVDDIDEAIGIMQQLRKLGVTISIDDFGTGFSSLSYLARMPVQVLKIDRSFVRHICEESTDMALVLSILAMGEALGLEVVAEGVETQAQLDFLKEARCDAAQGFLISHPLPAKHFTELFLEQ